MLIVKDVACPNSDCERFGKLGGDNLILRRRYGSDRIRFLHCRACKTEFSERQGTPLFDLRMPKAKVVEIVKHLAEGVGVRKTARLTVSGRETVGRILRAVGRHAKEIHDLLVRDLKVSEVQMDEMWSFVGKKRHASDRRGAAVRRAWERLGSYRRGR